ncbi:hypothetical protein OROGR_012723 [Orobanche gracilis]
MGDYRRLGAIAAAVVVFSLLLSAGGHVDVDVDVDGGLDESTVQFYLKCLAMYERYDRGDYFSDENPDKSFSCDMNVGWVRDAYGAIGRLHPEYVEALKRWFKGNQTLIDMEICSLDDVRARDDIRCARLPKTFIIDKFFPDADSW